MEELQNKRRNALKIAAERQRLRMDSVLAEFDFAVKNISDELEVIRVDGGTLLMFTIS